MIPFKKGFEPPRKSTEGSENSLENRNSFQNTNQQLHVSPSSNIFTTTINETSSEILQTILSDIDNSEYYQPYKKIKIENKIIHLPISNYYLPLHLQPNRCNCKKTKCLKLYCECFSEGGYCKSTCTCHDCQNKREYEMSRANAIEEILLRQPKAFSAKEFKQNTKQKFRGCNCKKSNCLKKYCECYNYGVQCSENCKCQGCGNYKLKCPVDVKLDSKPSEITHVDSDTVKYNFKLAYQSK